MSQTSGESGDDPEKDEWLKKFSGIPESYKPDELHTDRPYFEKKVRDRSPGFIEGQLDDLGEGLANMQARYREQQENPQPRSRLQLVLLCGCWLGGVELVVFTVVTHL